MKGKKKKTELSRSEIKRHIKNGNQRYRKRQERFYIDALKKIYIESGYITTTTPKRNITDVSVQFAQYVVFISFHGTLVLQFETLRITRKKMEEFIAAGVSSDKIKHYVKVIVSKKK